MAVTMGQLTAQILTDTNRDSTALDPNTQPMLPLYPAAIQRAILTAIKYMESRYYWMFRKMALITIPSGLNVTELPADLINIDYVQYNWNGQIYSPKNKFIPVSFQDLQNLFYSTGQVGQPTRWAIWTNLFYVYPYVRSGNNTLSFGANPIGTTASSSVITVTFAPNSESNFFIGQAITVSGINTTIGGLTPAELNVSATVLTVTSTTFTYDCGTTASGTTTGGGLGVAISAENFGQDFQIWYYNKDLVYPVVDGSIANTGTSIWFNDTTVDLVRMMAMQRFYYDTLQAPDIGDQYMQQVENFQRNLDMKNNNRQTNNFLSW